MKLLALISFEVGMEELQRENEFLKLKIQMLENEVTKLNLEILTLLGQCQEEHYWKGKTSNDK